MVVALVVVALVVVALVVVAKRMRKEQGFTLLEVMVALMILAFLSLFTVQSIQRALATKSKVQKDIDKNATVRDALRVMERDINMAFNYRDIFKQNYNNAITWRKKEDSSVQPPPQGYIPKDRPLLQEDKIKTRFIGDGESLHFTSLSNVRVTENAPVSSQAEVGYRLKSCRRRSTQEQSSQCLWRRISNYIHEDITKFGEETVLLENVTEFKLRYLGPGKDGEWQDSWSSESGGDDVVKGKFPWAVEITIAVNDTTSTTRDKTLRMTSVAAIRNPNNPPPSEAANGQRTQ